MSSPRPVLSFIEARRGSPFPKEDCLTAVLFFLWWGRNPPGFCPGWKAYLKSLSDEERIALKEKYGLK